MTSIERPILLQLQFKIMSHRRAVQLAVMTTSSLLIGMVQMTQKIRESMLDVTFRVCLHVVTHACSWSFSRKWRATVIVSAFTFISPVSSSMIAPASGQLAERFDIHSTVLLAMTSSVFVLGYGGNLSHIPQTTLADWGFRRHHSLWTLTHWPTQRDIWTLARFTSLQPVVSRYVLLLVLLIAANGPLLHSLEFSVWFCGEHEYAYRVSLPSRTWWFSPTLYWWRCHRRSLRCRTSGTGYCYLLTRSSPRSCCWSCCWSLDRGEINLALGGASLFCSTVPVSNIDEHSSGRRPSWMLLSKDLACSF